MPPLPADVSDRLVRGLGAFIRATPAPELPGPLRRYRSFVPKSLVRHRDALIASLESPDLRLKVLRWLEEERPRLGSQEIAILRIASERSEGWEGELASFSVTGEPRARSGDSDGRAGDLAGALERERERAKRYRAEAARIREEGRGSLEAERARGRELEAQRSELVARLAAAEEELARQRKDGARAAAAHERELRRERRAAEAARVRAEGLRAEARTAKKRESAQARQIEKLEAEARRRSQEGPARGSRGGPPSEAERGRGGATPARGERRPQRRRRLPAPKGLLETSGEALELWLEEISVHLLVDGYNVSRAEGGYGDLELKGQRARLVDEVARLARRKGVRATVVFDGNEVPPGIGRRRRTPAAVEYSRPGESADDHLVMLLDRLPPDPIVVVTNDRELQGRAAALGATIARSNQLLELIR